MYNRTTRYRFIIFKMDLVKIIHKSCYKKDLFGEFIVASQKSFRFLDVAKKILFLKNKPQDLIEFQETYISSILPLPSRNLELVTGVKHNVLMGKVYFHDIFEEIKNSIKMYGNHEQLFKLKFSKNTKVDL